jgi:26S proteasome regulatory subunit N10
VADLWLELSFICDVRPRSSNQHYHQISKSPNPVLFAPDHPPSPQVLATLTQDLGKVLSALQTNHIGGSIDLPTALNVAQLALKHRENKNQRQRIVVFLGSPLVDPFSSGTGVGIGSSSDNTGKGSSSEEALVKLGKKLKKNNVAVDLVLFGDEGMENEAVLSKFIEATQNSENW